MRTVEVPFGHWLPDAPDYKHPGCITANNVYPSPGGAYTPFKGAVAQGASVNEAVMGAAQVFRSDRTSVIVGGTSTKLFHLYSGTLTETTGYTSIGSDGRWDFEQFNSYVVAAAVNNAPQYLTDIDSDTGWSALPGSPPQAKVVGRVGNFLMLGNLSGLGLASSIQWSAENDPTDWPTPGTTDARLKQSGRATLQLEYGEITGITGDRYPVLFQERAISRVDPVGPPTVFRVSPIEEARGCIAPASIVTVGFVTYFLAHDGFWATDGNQVIPIGNQRVNDWFFGEVSEGDRFRTHGTVDWERQSVVWAFYPANNATGFRRQLIYNWSENRWSSASLYVDWLVSNKKDATTLEELDALFPGGLEDVTPSLDSAFWSAKSRVLGAFIQNASSESEMHHLNGDTLEATFETGDFQPEPGRRVSVNALYPVVENVDANTEAALVTRATKGGTETLSTQRAVNSAEFVPVRGDGRYARAKVVIPAAANWDKAQGVRVEYRVSGAR